MNQIITWKFNNNKINQLYIQTSMFQETPSQNQQQAIQYLLELDNHQHQLPDWHRNTKQNQSSKKQSHLNFIAINKKLNPQIFIDNNYLRNKNLLHINKFKRAHSLFNPIKAFKNISQSQITYEQPLTPQLPSSNLLNSNNRNSTQVKYLKFKKSKLLLKDNLFIDENKNKSIQFLNGESVMIQVQSYQENYNKKEVQYLMYKTYGPKIIQYHKQINHQQKNIEDGEKQSENKYQRKKGFSLTSKMRLSSTLNKKQSFKRDNDKTPHRSLQLLKKKQKSSSKDQINIGVLLQNLQNAKDNQKKTEKDRINSIKNTGNDSPSNIYDINESNNKFLNKQKILRIYEEQQLRKLKNNRHNNMNKDFSHTRYHPFNETQIFSLTNKNGYEFMEKKVSPESQKYIKQIHSPLSSSKKNKWLRKPSNENEREQNKIFYIKKIV